MKNLLFLILMLCTQFLAQAQDCNYLNKYKKGTTFQLTTYDKKNKPTGTIDQEVLEKRSVAGGWEMNWKANFSDKKGKSYSTVEMKGSCKNGFYEADARNIYGNSMPPAQNMKVTVSGDMIKYPTNMSVGQTLPDASIEISTQMNELMTMRNSIKTTNRKVEAKEEVETPAGKFQCYKISSEVEFKLLGTRKMKVIEYMSNDYGLVKSMSYDKKGKLTGSTVLTKINL